MLKQLVLILQPQSTPCPETINIWGGGSATAADDVAEILLQKLCLLQNSDEVAPETSVTTTTTPKYIGIYSDIGKDQEFADKIQMYELTTKATRLTRTR